MPQHITEEELLEKRKEAPEKNWWRYLGPTLLVLVIAGGYFTARWVMLESQQQVQEIQQRGLDQERTAVNLDSPRMVGWNKQGEKVWVINADSVQVTADQERVVFKGSDATFFDEGKENLFIDAERIEYQRYTKNLMMEGNLNIRTREDMKVKASKVQFIHYASRFVLPEGVELTTKEGNTVSASYMQSGKDLELMEFVGNVKVQMDRLEQTEFIEEREITDEEIRLDEFKEVSMDAGVVIYDKPRDHMVALGALRGYNPFLIVHPKTHQVISPFDYEQEPGQLTLEKGVNTIRANRLDADLSQKWVKATGNIEFTVERTEPEEGDDPALKQVKQLKTVIRSDTVEYFWGEDFAKTFSRSTVDQRNKHAEADYITYQGKRDKMVFLEGDVYLEQSEGEWIRKGELIEGVEDEDVKQILFEPTKVWGDRAVLYLDNNNITAKGDVMVEQKDKRAWGEAVKYNDERRRFVAEGNARYTNAKGEKFRGDQIIFNTESNEVEINGSSVALVKLPEQYSEDLGNIDEQIKGESTGGTQSDQESGEDAEPTGDSASEQTGSGGSDSGSAEDGANGDGGAASENGENGDDSPRGEAIAAAGSE